MLPRRDDDEARSRARTYVCVCACFRFWHLPIIPIIGYFLLRKNRSIYNITANNGIASLCFLLPFFLSSFLSFFFHHGDLIANDKPWTVMKEEVLLPSLQIRRVLINPSKRDKEFVREYQRCYIRIRILRWHTRWEKCFRDWTISLWWRINRRS